MFASLMLCATLACPFVAEQGLHWDESPGAESYNVYVEFTTTFHYLWLEGVPCCSVWPVRHFLDDSFPIAPGLEVVYRVTAVNQHGESELSDAVGIVLAQTISLPRSVP